jgi:glycerol-3-phosphate acyltransferase PlsY
VILVVAGVAGYLSGSLPFGYWLVRLVKGVDIRSLGSGGIGATNVARASGWRVALVVLLLDGCKGLVPALVFLLVDSHLAGVVAGTAAIVGHYRPVFLGFHKGGKMVATTGGVVFALAPYAGAVCLAVWVGVFLATRYASVASLAVALALPAATVGFGAPVSVVVFACCAAAGIVLLHQGNIGRLLRGQERRMSLSLRSRATARAEPSSGRAP